MLSKEEIQRYSRHLLIPDIALRGQEQLKQASVLIIGAGGLGSPATLYLAAAGIGRIGLVDFDAVEYSNLQRQIIHGTDDVGRSKLESAKESVRRINPLIEVALHEMPLSSENALDVLSPYDVVIDGTDNLPTRYLINDACVLTGKPYVYGSIFRFEGQVSVFHAKEGPCYRCLYPEPPPPGLVPSCAEGGVLGVLPGVIGVIQATEAIKQILGIGAPLIGRLLLYDALKMSFRELKLRKDPECPVCGKHPSIDRLIDYEQFCGIGTEAETVHLKPHELIRAPELKECLDRGKRIVLLDIREPHEYEIAHLPDAVLIPPGELEKRIGELDREAVFVTYCRTGPRSARAVKLMRESGFQHVRNLEGGILAWADEVDPSLPKY